MWEIMEVTPEGDKSEGIGYPEQEAREICARYNRIGDYSYYVRPVKQ